jgi:hypothetical protein
MYDVQIILKAENSMLLCANGRVAVLEFISLHIIVKMGVTYMVKLLGLEVQNCKVSSAGPL